MFRCYIIVGIDEGIGFVFCVEIVRDIKIIKFDGFVLI